jgi:hypothetical protein
MGIGRATDFKCCPISEWSHLCKKKIPVRLHFLACRVARARRVSCKFYGRIRNRWVLYRLMIHFSQSFDFIETQIDHSTLCPLNRPDRDHSGRWLSTLLSEDGNRSIFRTVCVFQNTRRWTKSRNSAIPTQFVINLLVVICLVPY